MTTIIFIRHAPTIPDKNQHATLWHLREDSQRLCHLLAEQIKDYKITKIYTSTESKAQLTGQFVAEKSGNVPVETVENLQETIQHTMKFYDNLSDFRVAVKKAMRSPDELLYGDETFIDARNRFSSQVEQLARKHPGETIGIVTHGRVLSMYLGTIMKQSPVELWEKLGLPAYAVLSREKQVITEIVYKIEAK